MGLNNRDVLITVFTPTYNRSYIIEELYNSLVCQTSNNFEWLVIDDGSVDDTQNHLKLLQNKPHNFDMRFIKKENGGKHRAINDAVKIANGKLFFIVDSDDQLTDNAIERIEHWYAGIAGLRGYAGIAGNKGLNQGTIVGTTFSNEYVDCTSLEREKNCITGDKAEVFYTDVLRQYPFPEFEGENFITEAIVWNRIAETGLKLRWFNEIVYLCEYRSDGLTHNLDSLNKRNPRGYALEQRENIRFGHYTKRDIINIYYHYYVVVKEKVSVKKCSEYLGIDLAYMNYVIFRCSLRDLVRKLCSQK